MTELQELQSLLERVEKATGPDRELGVDILIGIGGWSCSEDFELSDHEGKVWSRAISPRKRPNPWEHMNPALSIDAALALVERVLPGWDWEIELDEHGAAVFLRPDRVHADGETVPLAILAALLKALIAQETGKPYTVGDPEGREGEE